MTTPPERFVGRYARPEDGGPVGVADLVALLTLRPAGTDRFEAANPVQDPRLRLYGGQVAAQALAAATATVPDDRRPHSMHGYFLRGGRADVVTDLQVDRVRDGRSFSARRVVASQGGQEIFTAACSFHVDEHGADLDAAAPTGVPAPETMPEQAREGHNTMWDLREVRPGGPVDQSRPPTRLWARTRGRLPDDPWLHAAAVAYLTDMGWAFGGLVDGGGPSIDHAIWLHRPARADEWLLLDLTPVAAGGARGVYHGTVHDREGRLVASLAQEALLRAQPLA